MVLPCPPGNAEPLSTSAQVNVGVTHNIFLSSYIDYTTGSAQYNWLLNDLQSIDRSKTPWCGPDPSPVRLQGICQRTPQSRASSSPGGCSVGSLTDEVLPESTIKHATCCIENAPSAAASQAHHGHMPGCPRIDDQYTRKQLPRLPALA